MQPIGESFPRRALLDGKGAPVRVLAYEGRNPRTKIGFWTVLRGEEKVLVREERLTFLPEVSSPGPSL